MGSWMDGWPTDSKWRKYFEYGEALAGAGRCPECRHVVLTDEPWREEHRIGPLTFSFHGPCYPVFIAQTMADQLDWSAEATGEEAP